MKTTLALVVMAVGFNLNAERIVIGTVKPVSAQQKTLSGCWAAALAMVAPSFGAAIPEEQLAREGPKFLHLDAASYQEITAYLNSGWHIDAASHSVWRTTALSFDGQSLPDATLLATLRIRQPVLLAYSSGTGPDHVVVAVGAELDETSPGTLSRIIVIDPLNAEQSERDWRALKSLLIGSWLPLEFANRDCGAAGAAFLHPECELQSGNQWTTFFMPAPKSTSLSARRPDCLEFGGIWEIPQNDMTAMTLFQNSLCFLSGGYRSRGAEVFDYAISGRSYRDGAVVRINRTGPSGCKTTMFGNIAYKADDVLVVVIDGTDGKCDLPSEFAEKRIWIRR